MRKFAAGLALALFTCLGVQAQSFTDDLQKSNQGQGAVKVNQSDDINKLVNGNKNADKNQESRSSENKSEGSSSTGESHGTDSHQESTERSSEGGINASPEQSSSEQKNRERQRDKDKEKAKEKKNEKERDYLSEKYDGPIDTTKKVMKGKRVVGYRVQAYAGGSTRADKERAYQVKDDLKKRLPSQPVYVHFNSPRWNCRIGNFRKQSQAEALLKAIKKLGYNHACIVKTIVTVKY